MGNRSVYDSHTHVCQSPTHPTGCGCNGAPHALLVEKMIGTAYDVVKYVACHMNLIKHVSFYMADIHRVSQGMDNIQLILDHINEIDTVAGKIVEIVAVYEKLDEIGRVFRSIVQIDAVAAKLTQIEGVYDDLAEIEAVYANLVQINALFDNLAQLQALYTNLPKLLTVYDNLIPVNVVADNIIDVNTVSANIVSVNTTATNIADVIIVANNIADVNTVSASISDVNKVADDIASVVTTATNITNVNTVAADITNVNTVSTSIVNVNTVAANITELLVIFNNLAKILDAENQANLAIQARTATEGIRDSFLDGTLIKQVLGDDTQYPINMGNGIILDDLGLQLNYTYPDPSGVMPYPVLMSVGKDLDNKNYAMSPKKQDMPGGASFYYLSLELTYYSLVTAPADKPVANQVPVYNGNGQLRVEDANNDVLAVNLRQLNGRSLAPSSAAMPSDRVYASVMTRVGTLYTPSWMMLARYSSPPVVDQLVVHGTDGRVRVGTAVANTDAVTKLQLDGRLSEAQRTAINALPDTGATIDAVVAALKAT